MSMIDATRPLLEMSELERLHQEVAAYTHRSVRRAAATPFHGPTPSPHRGQGMDLHDTRPYHPGDDIRHMDWRATARSGRPTSKVFLEERQHGVLLIIDRRPTMMFATRGELKAACAMRCAAILAFAALAAHESVAGVVLDGQPRWFAGTRTLDGVAALLQAANAPPTQVTRKGGIATTPLLSADLDHQIEHGMTVYYISDFHDLMQKDREIRQFIPRGPHYDTIALRVVDVAEQTLPNAGRLRLVSPDTGQVAVIDSSDAELRRRYAERMTWHEQRLRQACADTGVPLLQVVTHRPTLPQLAELL
jgi:uncharacterized protein (DUF58 family)